MSNVKSRIEILRKNSKCFLCLKSGHIFKNRPSSYIYRKCDGKHHISLCSKLKKNQEKNESSAKSTDNVAAHVGVLKGNLLQTAKGKVAELIQTKLRRQHEYYFTQDVNVPNWQRTYVNI